MEAARSASDTASYGFRIIRAAIGMTMNFGVRSEVTAEIQFTTPGITVRLPLNIALRLILATSSAVIVTLFIHPGFWWFATSWNSVSVRPGQLVVMETPVPWSS